MFYMKLYEIRKIKDERKDDFDNGQIWISKKASQKSISRWQ